MVAHIDDRTGTALLVSFPRDLWVAIPGIGHAKINAAFNAGPQRVIETIENDFDIPISHYLEVDFEGFRKMVNAIGTIPDLLPGARPRHEERAGRQPGRLPAPQRRPGARVRALALLRVARQRAVEVRPDLRPRPDPAPAVLPAHARPADAARRGVLAVEREQPARLDAHEPPARPEAGVVVVARARVRVPPPRWRRDPDAAREPAVHRRPGRARARHRQGGAVARAAARHREPVGRTERGDVRRPRHTVHVSVENGSGRTGLGARATTRSAASASPWSARRRTPIAATTR